MVIICRDEKSQHKNKARALKILRARLLEKAHEEQDAKIAESRRSMVGTGDRSERIRTYNFPAVAGHRPSDQSYLASARTGAGRRTRPADRRAVHSGAGPSARRLSAMETSLRRLLERARACLRMRPPVLAKAGVDSAGAGRGIAVGVGPRRRSQQALHRLFLDRRSRAHPHA